MNDALVHDADRTRNHSVDENYTDVLNSTILHLYISIDIIDSASSNTSEIFLVSLSQEQKHSRRKMPTGSSHLSFTMAALVSAGGIAGFAKAKSIPSLSAGLFFGGLFVGAGYLINVRTRYLNFRFQKGT